MSPLAILAMVSEETGISVEEIRGPRRHKSIAFARHLAAYLLHGTAGGSLSYPEIGKLLGERDHTTVLVGARKIQNQRGIDLAIAAQIERLETRLIEAPAELRRLAEMTVFYDPPPASEAPPTPEEILAEKRARALAAACERAGVEPPARSAA